MTLLPRYHSPSRRGQRQGRKRRPRTARHERHEKRRERRLHLDQALNRAPRKSPSSPRLLTPPRPPLPLNVESALDPLTPAGTLWEIARKRPDLRHWLIANPAASPELLEYVSQRGGPGVKEGFHVLFEEGKDV